MQRTKAPFRADEVGSLLRPPRIKEARARLEKGEISADDQDDMGFEAAVDDEWVGDGFEDFGDFLGQGGLDLVVGDFAAEAGAAEIGDDAGCDLGAEIGGDQHVFQFFESGVVEFALVEDAGDALGELLGGAGQALLEFGEEAERHQAGSASKWWSVAATMRARSNWPGVAVIFTGAKCSVWPEVAVSARTATVVPIWAA